MFVWKRISQGVWDKAKDPNTREVENIGMAISEGKKKERQIEFEGFFFAARKNNIVKIAQLKEPRKKDLEC